MRFMQLAATTFAATILLAFGQSAENVFPFRELWSYQDTGPIASSITWFAPDFDERSWKTAYGPFGVGLTAFTTMATMNNTIFVRAYYFRKVA
jgi:hypothetical protein